MATGKNGTMVPALMNASLSMEYKVHFVNAMYETIESNTTGTRLENNFRSKPLLLCWKTHGTSTMGITNDWSADGVWDILKDDFNQPNNKMQATEPIDQNGYLMHMFEYIYEFIYGFWSTMHIQTIFHQKILIFIQMVRVFLMNGNHNIQNGYLLLNIKWSQKVHLRQDRTKVIRMILFAHFHWLEEMLCLWSS